TLVPVLIDVLVAREYAAHHGQAAEAAPRQGRVARALSILTGPVFRLAGRFRAGFEARFARFHRGYLGLLHAVVRRRAV
ncbi:hypothetical protein, partial [Enterobacter cloacae]